MHTTNAYLPWFYHYGFVSFARCRETPSASRCRGEGGGDKLFFSFLRFREPVLESFSQRLRFFRGCNLCLGTVARMLVASVPLSRGSIRRNNPHAIQVSLYAATSLYQTTANVRQFGRGGIVCRPPDQACDADLLRRTMLLRTVITKREGEMGQQKERRLKIPKSKMKLQRQGSLLSAYKLWTGQVLYAPVTKRNP
ncbi:uncharacterized protein LOC119178475 isoform X2 [Rhipicephalus microplus]|uniref:uncharacterized protein LOC119178475 isoform X2 n=1 Tax=Rhipicephalus microplus TaxID=6941 RepID=UPI003F6CD2CB